MAKGLEDTAFYRYNRLVSLNEVGSDPQQFGTTVDEFHAANQQRLQDWPHTMLATSTHDSKRSEDVRARINVLSEISPMWGLRVREWRRVNRGHKSVVNGVAAPSPNDEYLLYQTLVGAWPPEPLGDNNDQKAFCERMEKYMLKAIREAKQNTSWINRNTEYEGSVTSFVRALLNTGADNHFLNSFVPFQRRVARIGLWNGLSQTLLKLTCPGVPDLYQGRELWNFSLVDPDNRRPVDYLRCREVFECVRRWGDVPDTSSCGCLLEAPEDGRIKSYLIWRSLCLRQEQPDLFQQGEYLPLAVAGARADHVVAFARRFGTTSVLVVVPRLVAGLLHDIDLPPIGPRIWEDTHVLLPFCCTREKYRNVLTGEVLDSDGEISVSKALAEFPVALCVRD
jgi:(1->4)-alpha-D-glucan 1-alpha-D-glucosylmutase